jgi:serine/threonine protein kinase/formylglycine-generating enzyme required for sulfatase activity
MSADASHDLLFGRMAVHTGFIDEQTLDAAIEQQRGDPSNSLADILVTNGSITDEDRRLIEHLCRRHVAMRGGNRQRSIADLSLAPTVSWRQPPWSDTRTTSPSADGARFQGTFGDYELLGEIARGGMGVVYKARQAKLNRLVALKMIKSGGLADADQVKRFHAEAEAAAKLDHPGIVPVHEVGEFNGQHFYSMAFVEGTSLNDRVKRDGPLAPRVAAQMMKSVAHAVHYAHSRGILHRDIKPQNILLDKHELTRVTDFGLAKHVDAPSELTATGQIMGTPSYMPPEQAKGALSEIGPTSDVYSLGATLYFLLTGRPPFQTASTADTVRQVVDTEPAPVRRLNPAVPRDLETVCLKCLRKEQARRYPTAVALADDLGRWSEGKPIVARPVRPPERAWLWCKRRPAVAGLSATVVVILLAGSLIAVERQNAEHAAGLVERLLGAPMHAVPTIIGELAPCRRWGYPMLREVLEKPQDEVSADRRLRASIGLLQTDASLANSIHNAILAAPSGDARTLIALLEPFKADWTPIIRRELADRNAPATARLRAAMALAAYDPPIGQPNPATPPEIWQEESDFIAREMLTEARQDPSQYEPLAEALWPARDVLLAPLAIVLRDELHNATERDLAASLLAGYAADRPLVLADLAADADAGAFAKLFAPLAKCADSTSREWLADLAGQGAAADLTQKDRVVHGRRRAGAAITLLRQGEAAPALDTLRVSDDPESLTQFVHRCRQRGVTPVQLLDCVELADRDRQQQAGADRQVADRVLYGLLLALGEFELGELPEAERDGFVEQLATWYAGDPSSAIHGATGWLFRHWKQDELAMKVDQTPVAYSPDREWYTLEIKAKSGGILGFGAQEQSFFMTFVVFPAGEYLVGSTPDEADRQGQGQGHAVKLTRPIAVSDREITWEQFNSFDNRGRHDIFEEQFGHKLTAEEPAFGVSWYEVVAYCRWLTKSAGMSEDDQAYSDPASLDRALFPADSDPEACGAPRNWPFNVQKRGFRLPTEAEWEMVCRGGTKTVHSFGNDVQLLGRYGWFLENSNRWLHAVGRLRPTARGLFDIHGNMFEWCHDWSGDYGADSVVEDPTGPAEGSVRVIRGGGWTSTAADCRSATRLRIQPTSRSDAFGFRVASVPFSPARESGKQAASDAGSGNRAAE